MKQIATVTRRIDSDTVEVAVVRESACGHDCEKCAGCGAQGSSITVSAKCRMDVSCGDLVELYSGNSVLGYAALVYLAPVALFLVGYLLFPSISEEMRYLCGGAGFVLGIGAAVLCDRLVRRKNAVSFEIIRKL